MTNFSSKYGSSNSKYCYPDTQILRNKLDIKDEHLLKEAETLYTSQRLLELDINPLKGDFDLKHLQEIHHYIFQDIYDFAGKLREEDISKGDFMFAKYQYISENAEPIFKKLKSEIYLLNTSLDEFAKKSSYYMAEINVLHPFREGNGRSTREFIRFLALNSGYELTWNAVTKDELLEASIKSVNDETLLYKCIKKCIR